MGSVGVQEKLAKQLAVTVRSIQWSYAIFWSSSTSQQGVLEWRDGYYNGDIKTRKTVSAMEVKADKIGFQRSQQLRELYEALQEGETELPNKRSCASLSPEDLTDTEWYYLVCMSFVFDPGQSLPGRALANNETIWLCNAQYADSKVFSRSLLAKSASIQTVVCFPHLDGVVELGVTELVPEDANLLQHIKASLLDFSKPECFEKSYSPTHDADDGNGPICFEDSHEFANELCGNVSEGLLVESPECSKECEHNHQTEDSFMLEGINVGSSQVQSWHFVDEDFSIRETFNSSDCISEAFAHQAKARHENVTHIPLKELEEGDHVKLSLLDLEADDFKHYKQTLSTLIGSSNCLTDNLFILSSEHKSSFVRWKKGANIDKQMGTQKMLKKVLFTVPLMYYVSPSGSQKVISEKGHLATHDGFLQGHVFSDKGTENEKFNVLRSLVPSMNEIDKASILNDTIKYLKMLEARVEELESCMDFDGTPRPMRNYTEIAEQISDNYHYKKNDSKKTLINKRKACDIDESDPDHENAVDVKVAMKENEVLIEMSCPYRELILLDIMDAMNNLHLDAHSVVSSNHDGILKLALKSKFRGGATAPAGMIKQALSKITGML